MVIPTYVCADEQYNVNEYFVNYFTYFLRINKLVYYLARHFYFYSALEYDKIQCILWFCTEFQRQKERERERVRESTRMCVL